MNKQIKNPNDNYLFIVEDGCSRQMFVLEDDKYSIGRHSQNSIIIKSRKISRQHATLIRKMNRKNQQDSFWILDGDLEGNVSQNHLFINGEKCLLHELQDGDLINFGCDVSASYHILSPQINPETIFQDHQNNSIPINANSNLDKKTTLRGNFPSLYSQTLAAKETLNIVDYSLEETSEEDTFTVESSLDPVTQLPNRILFNEYISIALTNARQNETIMAILLIDIKDFTKLNNNVGSGEGDRVLREVGERLKAGIRSGDIVGRWGGDEFSLLLTQVKATDNLEKIVQRLLRILEEPLTVDNNSCRLFYNYGLAVYPHNGVVAQTLIEQAECQLADHKQLKISSVTENNDGQINPKLLKIEQRLYKALEAQEFVLYYQPQIDILTGKIEAVEALIRWNHPKQGLLLPQQFLPWSEKTDIITSLTRWVLETACLQNKLWQTMGLPSVTISINLSANQFYHPQLIDLITQVLEATDLDSNWLELEITELTILKDIEKAYPILKALQNLGVALCLDDFGKGYTAISYLSNSPFQKLKIDLSLVNKLKNNPDNTALISALIALGEKFQMKVVAEGVETQQQINTLYGLQCKTMQGYKFTGPLPATEATEYLKSHQQKKS